MTALRRGRRKGTAKELAERIGVSERTIRRYMAEPREDVAARVAERHAHIRELRDKGLSMRAIAVEVGVSVGTVHYALHKNDQERPT